METMERRTKKRIPLRGFLACSCDFRIEDRIINGFDVVSLSASGMFLAQQKPNGVSLHENQALEHIHLSLPPFAQDRFKAVIRRIITPDNSDGLCGLGVEFVDLSSELEEKLDQYVHLQTQFFGLD